MNSGSLINLVWLFKKNKIKIDKKKKKKLSCHTADNGQNIFFTSNIAARGAAKVIYQAC